MAGELGALRHLRYLTTDVLAEVRNLVRSGRDASIVYGEVSADAGVWTTVVSLTPAADRRVVAFGADVVALLSTNYRFRLTLDGAIVWHEVAGTTSVSAIAAALDVPAGSTVAVDAFHNEAAATTLGGSISHVNP